MPALLVYAAVVLDQLGMIPLYKLLHPGAPIGVRRRGSDRRRLAPPGVQQDRLSATAPDHRHGAHPQRRLHLDDFFTPLLRLGGSDHETVPVRIFAFVGMYVSDYGLVYAGLVIGSMTILVIFLLLQRYVIKGFTSGLKG